MQVQWLPEFGAAVFGGVLLSGSAFSTWRILACKGVEWQQNRAIQVSGLMMMTPRLGHGSGRVRAPLSRMGLRTLHMRTWTFGMIDTGFQTMELCVCGLGMSRGQLCTSPTGVLPSCVRAGVGPVWPVVRCASSPRSDSNSLSTSVRAWICLRRVVSGFRCLIWRRCVKCRLLDHLRPDCGPLGLQYVLSSSK